jgi:DNA repair protein RadD
MENDDIAKFFAETDCKVWGNRSLREPQIEGYFAIRDHFKQSDTPCYVQLPVGCGKTGLMGLAPFGIAKGRVLMIAPNLTIRGTIKRELNIGTPGCFYTKRGAFVPKNGPYISELKTGANIHDCDAAHIVIANIQQFSGAKNKWYEALSCDYFDMILVDEGHHNVADTWRRLFDHFSKAKVVSFTATPMRSDGQVVSGERVYRFGYTRSMLMGFISQIEAVFVTPKELTFTAEGKTKHFTIDDVLSMREKDWFSKGIALSEECNKSVVSASLQQLHRVRELGAPRQLIAVACSIRHANQVASLYRAHGLNVELLHSNLPDEERDKVEASLRSGLTDVIVQVNILGEGYDLPTLSVAAVFRPYRSLSPYIQFVGRILRLAQPEVPFSPANQVYLVSHIGLNDERWWKDFTDFDKDDQEFFREYLEGGEATEEVAGGPRVSLRPFMRVLSEVVESYQKRGYLKRIDEVMIRDLFETIRQKGFEPSEFGLSEDVIRMRIEAAQEQTQVPAYSPIAQPQDEREALYGRLMPEARAIADAVINRLELNHRGRDLLKYFGSGAHNSEILIRLANAEQNKAMGVNGGGRPDASADQIKQGIAASAHVVDKLIALVRGRMRDAKTKANGKADLD